MPDEFATTSSVTDDQLVQMAAGSGDDPKHMQDMINKVDNANNPDAPPKAKTTDDLLAGKYKDQDALNTGFDSLVDKFGKEKAYKILEGQIGKTAQSQDTTDPSKSTESKDALSDDSAKTGDELDGEDNTNPDDNTSVALDFDALNTEYQENGELAPESYEKLSKAGLSEDMVNQYIAGLNATAELTTMKVHNLAGGEDNYNALIEWAGDNLNEAAQGKFNAAVQTGDMEQIEMVLGALKGRYEAAEGSLGERTRVESSSAGNSTVGGYLSKAEMTADMKDPRYKTDKAFRAQVMNKIKRSTVV